MPTLNTGARQAVIAMLTLGASNKEICERTGLSRAGVTYHISKLMRENGLYGPADRGRLLVLAAEGRLALEAPAKQRGPQHHAAR